MVVDWGLAKDLSLEDQEADEADWLPPDPLHTRVGTILGTIAHMAPEQASGLAADTRTDVYALGSILYFVLVGEPPFQATTPQQLLDEMVRRPPERLGDPSKIPNDLLAVMSRAMDYQPAWRFAHAGDMARALKETATIIGLALPELTSFAIQRDPSDRRFLAMEWLEGETLWEHLHKGTLSVEQTLSLGVALADALAIAHSRGTAHLNLAPLNIVLLGGRIDQVRILDLAVNRFGGSTGAPRRVAHPDAEFMAPEVARGEADSGSASDVFSLGCILYACLTGRSPFGGNDPSAALAKVAVVEHVPSAAIERSDVPSFIDDLLRKLMAHRAEERPSDGAAAAKLLREAVSILRQPRASMPIAGALSPRERKPVSIIYADLSGIDGDEPRDRLERIAGAFDARATYLADGSLVVVLSGDVALTDLAARSARCALALHKACDAASISVACLEAESDRIETAIDSAVYGVRVGSKTIRIDRRTQALLPARFERRDDGEGRHVLLSERIEEWDSKRLLLGREVPFVGRNRTLRLLVAMYHGCLEDRAAQAAVIMGEAGVGKSRLRAELLATLTRNAAPPVVLFARGDPVRAQMPFGALSRALLSLLAPAEMSPAAVLRAVAERRPEADTRRIAEFLGEICGIEFPAEHSPPLRAARQDPALMAEQRRRAFEDWLVGECAMRPMVIVIEDMQWVDKATIDLVTAAFRRASELPLLVVALARNEVNDRFPHLEKEWQRQEIRLEPLRPADCGELVRAALGEGAYPDLVRRLVERSAGNPFFLEELIRAAAAGATTVLPENVLGSVQLRLGRLNEPSRLALRAASIYGATCQADAVAHLLAESTVTETAARLELLADEELLNRVSGGGYAFRHDLVREAAYRMLTAADRRVGHRLAGEWLLASGETDPVVLAEHFAGGGAIDQAVEWFRRAAEDALGGNQAPQRAAAADALRKAATYFRRAGEVCAAAYANENAIDFYERAVALWASLDVSEAFQTRLALARLYERIGDQDKALATVLVLEADAMQNGDTTVLIQALLSRTELEKRIASPGGLDRAKLAAEKACGLARAVGNRELEAQGLTGLAGVLTTKEGDVDSLDEAVELVRRAITLTTDHGALALRLFRLANTFLVTRNDLPRAEMLYRDTIVLAERAGDATLAGQCHANLGMVHFRRWELDAAIEQTEKALAISMQIENRLRIAAAKTNIGAVLVKRGEVDAGEKSLRDALSSVPTDWILATAVHESLAQVEIRRNQDRVAQDHLRAAIKLCQDVGANRKTPLYLGLLAESLWYCGDAATTFQVLARAAQIGDAGRLSHGFILADVGPIDDAEDFLSRFRDMDADADRRSAARLALARVLWSKGHSGRAREMCLDALSILAPSPLLQHVLPAETLFSCLDGQHALAVSRLRAARTECTKCAFDEVALDVGTLLVESVDAPSERLVDEFLELSEATSHHGIKHRIHLIQHKLAKRRGNALASRAFAHAAREELVLLLDKLPAEPASSVRATPWAAQILELGND